MSTATRLGPWLLGTVKNTTGTTVGSIRNTGVTTCVQVATLVRPTATTTVNLFTIPAGAYIFNFLIDILEAFNAGTGNTIDIKSSNGNVTLMTFGSAATTPLAVGRANATPTGAQIGYFTNVGYNGLSATGAPNAPLQTDVTISLTYTVTGGAPTTGNLQVTCLYAVRNPDGSYAPTSTTGP